MGFNSVAYGLTGHNALRRHPYVIGLKVLCVGSVEQRKKSRPDVLGKCKVLPTLDTLIWVNSFSLLRGRYKLEFASNL
jgi:hypothetical protein